jgi:hypothetical protein
MTSKNAGLTRFCKKDLAFPHVYVPLCYSSASSIYMKGINFQHMKSVVQRSIRARPQHRLSKHLSDENSAHYGDLI